MSIVFQAESDPSTDPLEEVAALSPENPFYTPAYAAAMAAAGEQPWVLALRDGSRWLSACTGFLKRGRMSRRMEIPSLPALGRNASPFWDGFFRFCRRSGVTHLDVGTYASVEVSIPVSPTPTRRTDRIEYVIDLGPSDLWRPVRQSHRQRINHARKAGLQLRCSTSEQDGQVHCRLIAESMKRRERRGEQVPTSISTEGFQTLLRSGAGVLFQAVLGGRVLSSALILMSSRGGYYHTSGTCPEGMEHGASQFLIFETARDLQGRAFQVFNLGGVSGDNPGLHEFKAGFGAVRRSLAAAEFDLQTPLRKALRGALRGLRARLAGTLERQSVR